MDELKIFEIAELSFILFIMHIILEAKIEYLDNFNENDILAIYHDCYSVIQKLYEIIGLLIYLLIIIKIQIKKNRMNLYQIIKKKIQIIQYLLRYQGIPNL